MPQIYRYLKLIFSFVASGEHLPPHVHVADEDDNRSIFDFVIKDGVLVDIKVRRKAGYKPLGDKNQGIAKSFIRIYYAQIVAKLFDFFVLNKEVSPETIRKIDNLTVDAKQLASHLTALDSYFYPNPKKESKVKKNYNTAKTKKK